MRVLTVKRVYVNEKWCLGCHLCEYNCEFSNSGLDSMTKLKGVRINPRVRVEDDAAHDIHFAVSCRHCDDPLCMKGCIAGAISRDETGTVVIDKNKCVGCYTCVAMCPYGAIMPDSDGHAAQKCELCTANGKKPACVEGCPNGAIVFEER